MKQETAETIVQGTIELSKAHIAELILFASIMYGRDQSDAAWENLLSLCIIALVHRNAELVGVPETIRSFTAGTGIVNFKQSES